MGIEFKKYKYIHGKKIVRNYEMIYLNLQLHKKMFLGY